jgi:hypothetical protein
MALTTNDTDESVYEEVSTPFLGDARGLTQGGAFVFLMLNTLQPTVGYKDLIPFRCAKPPPGKGVLHTGEIRALELKPLSGICSPIEATVFLDALFSGEKLATGRMHIKVDHKASPAAVTVDCDGDFRCERSGADGQRFYAYINRVH